MYQPKNFPATAFYLDSNLNVSEVVFREAGRAETTRGRALRYLSGHRLFATRQRALSAAQSEIRKLEKRLVSFSKEIEAKKARVAKQLA